MRYRVLGKTGIKVSIIGLGTEQFTGSWGKTFSQFEVDGIFKKSQNVGINFIDTAECYGDHQSEELIGNAIKNNREHWIIATKFGHVFHQHSKKNNFSVKSVEQQLEKSLKALQTDYVDLYQFHSGTNNEFDQSDLWEMLKTKIADGKIRHLGLSVMNDLVLSNDLFQINKSIQFGVETVQVVYNYLNRKAEDIFLPSSYQKNLGVIVRIPLAKGFLSGNYNPKHIFNSNDNRSKYNKSETYQMLKKVENIKKEIPSEMQLSQWALCWCLKHPSVSTVIPGVKNSQQIESNAKASKFDVNNF